MRDRLIKALLLAVFLFAVRAMANGWHEPEADVRVVFTRPRGPEASVLVSVPCREDSEVRARAFGEDGVEIPVKVVHQSEKELHILVRTGRGRSRSGEKYFIYYGSRLAPLPDALINKDLEPVTVEYYKNYGKSIPGSWERMRYMISRQREPQIVRTEAGIENITSPKSRSKSDESGKHRRKSRHSNFGMVRISTHIIIPEAGVYRFYLNCNDAAFVMVDRKIQAEWPGRHYRGRWKAGELSYLESGPHVLEVFGASRGITKAGIALADSRDENRRIPVEKFQLVSSVTPKSLRIEKKDETLHAGFAYSIGRPYKFRGMPDVFVPVFLTDFSQNDLPWAYSLKWRPYSDGAIPSGRKDMQRDVFRTGTDSLSGKSVTHVFDGPGRRRIALEVRDELGFVSSLEREVDTRNLQPVEYAVNAVPVDIGPGMFADDIVSPSIRVASKGASRLKFRLSWKRLDIRGRESRGSEEVLHRNRGVARIKMFSARAGELESIEWELSHKGYRIDGGKMIFNRFPYAVFPSGVMEDRLYDAVGNQLLYVASRKESSFMQPAIKASHLRSGIMIMDDILTGPRPMSGGGPGLEAVLGRLLAVDSSGIELDYISSRGGHNFLGSVGILNDIADKSEGAAGVAVLSIGREHFAAFDSVADFERMLAVITDILRSRRGLRTVLVTMPAAGRDKENIRDYAAAVRRVAVARRLPVADLYSGFLGMGRDIEAFNGGGPELSDDGVKLACQIIARAIVSGYRMESGD